MHLHRLTLEAIGPFPGRHEIDFDALGVSGLFLLNGPTGSGKSTIIDAIEFALYGARDELRERLPSGHVAAGVEPFVELVFSNARGIFRVQRTPEHRRPKQRGTGWTRAAATARLFRLSGEEQVHLPDAGEPLTSNVAETGTTVLELVQLSREQFTQTVVLPQGKFATFLTTPPEDRRKVLQDVFGTRLYDLTQEKLREAAAEATRTRTQHLNEVHAASLHMWRTAGREDEPAVTDAADLESLLVTATELAGIAAQRSEHNAAALASATTELETATAALDGARRLAACLERRSHALTELAALGGAQDGILAAASRISRAEAQQALRPALTAHDAAVTARAGADERALAAVRELEGARPGLSGRVTDPGALAAERDAALRRLAEVEHAIPHEAELRRLEAERDAAAGEAAELRNRRVRLVAILSAIPARRSQLEAERSDLEPVRALLESAGAEVERAAERLRTVTELGEVCGALAEARAAAGAAAARCRAAWAAETVVHESWISSLAGQLAAELQPGEACPVCGSADHPAPAHPAAGAASRTDVRRARADVSAADEALVVARDTHARLESHAALLTGLLGGHDPARAAAEHAAAATALADARAAEHRHRDLGAELHALVEREGELSGEATRLAPAIADLDTAAAARAVRIAAAVALVDHARGTCVSVAEALAEARAHLTLLDDARAALGDQRNAAERLAEAGSSLDDQLANLGFADAGAARDARLPDRELALLRARVEEHQNALAANRAVLAEPPLAALTGSEDPRLEDVEAAVAAARERHTRAAAEAGSARLVAAQAGAARTAVAAAVARYHEAVEQSAAVVRMASVAGGANSRNTTLASYVLLRRFDEVLAAANRRLATMSDGRYELARAEEREGGSRARRQGLALEVVDWTIGRARSPHSLSGGETFYTSLALALGLADVVTDEAGGVELGTLFVDEGFGSLDSHALGNVMDVLHGLSGDGRAVGIVSHVTDLKAQIAEQVEVRRLPGGGSTLVVHA